MKTMSHAIDELTRMNVWNGSKMGDSNKDEGSAYGTIKIYSMNVCI